MRRCSPARCAGKGRNDVATPQAAKVEEIEMEPIKLQAVKGPDGVQHVETYDATELFERGGAALSEKRYDDAISAYEHLLKEFPTEIKYTKAALYNQGLAYQGKKDCDRRPSPSSSSSPTSTRARPTPRTRSSRSAPRTPRWATGRPRRRCSRRSSSART